MRKVIFLTGALAFASCGTLQQVGVPPIVAGAIDTTVCITVKGQLPEAVRLSTQDVIDAGVLVGKAACDARKKITLSDGAWTKELKSAEVIAACAKVRPLVRAGDALAYDWNLVCPADWSL